MNGSVEQENRFLVAFTMLRSKGVQVNDYTLAFTEPPGPPRGHCHQAVTCSSMQRGSSISECVGSGQGSRDSAGRLGCSAGCWPRRALWRRGKASEGCGLGTSLPARLSPEGVNVRWGRQPGELGARRRETEGVACGPGPATSRTQGGIGTGRAALGPSPGRSLCGTCGVVACGLGEWNRAGCTVQPLGRDRYPRWNGRSRAGSSQWN